MVSLPGIYLSVHHMGGSSRHRANIERIIAALTRYNGARRATSTGIAAANHQVRLAAVAFNLKTWHARTRPQRRLPRPKEPPDAPG
jgi:hypothetical protein